MDPAGRDAGDHPPRLLERLACAVLPAQSRDAVLGDLHERFAGRVRQAGRRAAVRWYRRQVAGFILMIPICRMSAIVRQLVSDVCSPAGWLLDVRHAGRAVVRERGLTLSVVGVLALAVGAASTVFSVVNAVLLQPLPFPEPESLVMLWDEYKQESGADDPKPVTLMHVRAWQERADLFLSSGAYELIPAVLDAGRWTERVDAALVSAGVMQVLGAQAAIGRLFTAADDRPGAPAVAVISYELWQNVFGADERLVGRSIDIDGEPTLVIGVMARDFWFYDPYAAVRSYTGTSASAAKLWRPLAGRFPNETDYPRYRMIARLQPGITRQAVGDALAATERSLPLQADTADGRIRVLPLDEQITGPVQPRLLGLSAAVLLVLLIAGVNLVSLLVARLDVRRSEFAIRAALGAGRARIARGLIAHATLLATAGAAAGTCIAAAAIPILSSLVPRGLPLAHRVDLDERVIAFALITSVTIALAASVMAAGRLTRPGAAGITAGTRSIAGIPGGGRLTRLMTASQVALSLVLLISATLLLRSLLIVHRIDPGFDRRHTVTFQSILMLPAAGGAPDFSFFDRLEGRLAVLSGVTAAGSATMLPFSRWGSTATVRLAESGARATPERVDYRAVSPGYFETLRITVLAGRRFTPADGPGALPVAMVNRAFAERHQTGGASVLGARLTVTRGRETERVVIGVVDNVKEGQLFAEDRPILYVPIGQNPTPMRQFVVRSTAPVTQLFESIREAAAAIDRNQPLQSFITLDTLVAQSMEEERFYTATTTAFAGIAVVLALAGLYGVVAFSVRQREREIGVRIALGATRGSVYRLVLMEGMRPVCAGLVLGCLGASATARVLISVIHGVPQRDPVSYSVAVAAFASTAVLACLVPSRRAASLDPLATLRTE
jgi:predicted permease